MSGAALAIDDDVADGAEHADRGEGGEHAERRAPARGRRRAAACWRLLRSLRADIGLSRVGVRRPASRRLPPAAMLCAWRRTSAQPRSASPALASGVAPALRAVAVVARCSCGSRACWPCSARGLSQRAADFDPAGIAGALRPAARHAGRRRPPAGTPSGTWRSPHDGYGADPARPAFFPLYPLLAARRWARSSASALIARRRCVSFARRRALAAAAPADARSSSASARPRAGGAGARAVPDGVLLLGGLQRGAVPRAVGRRGLRRAHRALGVGGRARRAGGGDAQRGRRAARPARAAVVGALAPARATRAWLALVPLGLARLLRRPGARRARRARAVPRPGRSGSARSPARSSARGTARSPRGTARASCCPARARPSTSPGRRRPVRRRRAQPRAVRVRSSPASRRWSASLRRLPLAYGAYCVAALALPLS